MKVEVLKNPYVSILKMIESLAEIVENNSEEIKKLKESLESK